jgi:hypothetical protein
MERQTVNGLIGSKMVRKRAKASMKMVCDQLNGFSGMKMEI